MKIIVSGISLALMFIIASGCSTQDKGTGTPTSAQSNNDTPTNNGADPFATRQSVAPGEFVGNSDETMSYGWPDSGNADCELGPCEPAPITLCELAGPSTTTVAFIEIAAPFERIFLSPDCSGPYQTTVFRIHVQVFAVAAGQELPVEMSVIFRAPATIPEQIEVGQQMIANLRLSQGEWFVNGRTPLLSSSEDMLTDDTTSEGARVDLPSTFEELSRQAMDLMTDFEGNCPDELAMSDAEYDQWVHVPIINGTCTPCGDECGIVHDDQRECEGENPQPCCSDDSIPCH